MPSDITLIFPHQLFDPHPAMAPSRPTWLVEDPLLFGNDPHQPMRFHVQKIILHRASMKAYAQRLAHQGRDVTYVEAHTPWPSTLPADLATLWLADPVDYLLERRLHRLARQRGLTLRIVDTPMFLTPPAWFNPWFDGRKRYHMADFYVAQRKRLGLLVDAQGQPEGGRWSYDSENRKRWPATRRQPPTYVPSTPPQLAEAIRYAAASFPASQGSAASFAYPVTHEDARASLRHFLTHRFRDFGTFEDALSREHRILHHAQLTPALNTGLLTPRQVLDETLAFAREHRIPLNDTEGFIRQIIGWREFMRIIYVREGVKQRTSNFWNHTRRLDARWYNGTTGLAPLDHTIRRVMDHAYAHHIERLMVLGNAMLLAEIDPDEIYRWFMELFIDAYDWVMVPNVYGMSQYADGGLITTKPYFSGSNYLRKMSDYPTSPWCATWDGLFWRFIHRHHAFYARQPRLSMMARTLDKMSESTRQDHLRNAELFLQ